MNDTNAPNLTSLSFQSSLNVSSGAQPITFTVGATDDLSGVDHVYVWFTKSLNYGFPNSTVTGNSTLFSVYDFQDSFSDGQSSNTYTITPFNAPGAYTIDHVDVVDKAANTHTYNTAQLSALNIQTSFTIQGSTPDITAPSLTSLSFQSPLNVSSGAQPITFTVGATDDLSGVDHVYVWFTKSLNYGFPNSSVTGNSTLFSVYDFQDSFSDGQSSNTYTITPFNAPGTYTIDHVDVVDKSANTHTYNTAQLSALGIQKSFTIQGGTQDTTTPTLTSLTFQSTINVSSGAQPITFTVGATDDLSGVDHVYVWFTKSLNYGFPNSSVTGNSTLFNVYDFQDSFSDGQSSSTYTITPFNAPGAYTIDHVDVVDKAANTHTYNTAQLSALGVSTSLTVQDDASPDLTASNVVLDRDAISYRINNTGAAAAAASTAGIFVSTDSAITTSDTLINTHETPALAGGALDLETAPLGLFLFNLTPGTYFVGVIADYNGQIAESGETNNASGGVPIILGDNSANTLNGTVGNDAILGLGGNDILRGSGGNDTIDGGAGDDTAVFSGPLAAYAVRDLSDRVLVSGLDGSDTVFATEHLQFGDGSINYNDGDPLFDTIFYDRNNLDVFHAGIDAKAHYNVSGWHEGRDPNAFFSTSGYLTFNPDVKAAGANPLQHYDTSGWKEGRDPGANFDTKFYLLHNPDVKAANIDPLAHYLQSGVNEGRAISPAVGNTIQQGGFDAEYYLFANPDVAAAHADPLAHYNSSGHFELRNPNGYFDAAGYLANNPDVAAAHADPFQHYETSGWKEGRNPSTLFDTSSYLAANPDVAAAHANPLDHFLSSGIHEGRMPLGDGLWF